MGHQETEFGGTIGAAPVCSTCGSEQVVKDAWACWNPQSGLWELEAVFDQQYCRQCEAKTSFLWKRVTSPPCQRIRELNDRARREGQGNGSVVVTPGITAMGVAFFTQAVIAVRRFDAFDDGNDPWGEHDFGALDVAGEKIFWKIDYYTPDLSAGSENPANEGVTHRVLTIMLASEY